MNTRPIKFLLLSLPAQVIGFAVGIAVNPFFPAFILHAVVSLLVARLLKVSLPWQVLNGVLPLGLVFVFSSGDAWLGSLLLSFLILLAAIYIPTFWTRVPYFRASSEVYDELQKLLPKEREFTFVDLGSGFGSMLFYLSKRFPNGKFYGYEIGPLPYGISVLRSLFNNGVKVYPKSFWRIDLKSYDFVYSFLSPEPMDAIWAKFKKECAEETTLIVNSFPIQNVTPFDAISSKNSKGQSLFLYKKS